MRIRLPSVSMLLPLGILAVTAAAGCSDPVTAPVERERSRTDAVVLASTIATYTDRTSWEAAVALAGSTAQPFDFTGLTLGRVTQTDTDYGAFRIVVDQVAASSFSNPGIDILADAFCSLGSGDCPRFIFNIEDPTSFLGGPQINQLVLAQPIIAFGGDFTQLGVTVPPPGSPTGTITLAFGTNSVVINPSLDANGNGFFGFVASAPENTISFTYAKSASLLNDIFDVYNAAFAVGSAVAPAQMVVDLQATVSGLGLGGGIATSFIAKHRVAQTAIGAGQIAAACTALQDFINHVTAKSGKQLSAAAAASLIADATAIRNALGC